MPAAPHHPENTVRALIESPHVSAATRAALLDRLETAAQPYTPQFFDADTFALLQAVCARLLPQPERAAPIEVAPRIDERLAAGLSDGWRYDVLPPDREAYRLGLGGIQQEAQAQFGQPFAQLAPEQQDETLRRVQQATAAGAAWQTLDGPRFFEELLAEATALYYQHPLAQEEIGYVGMADLPAWTRIGLDEREDREPQPIQP
ncbi:gluconate 2-dehydrogenase subunit 3 family protein [Hymenobacter busanensis]|uniref:Gluconate 2-dehydrogenase subunit 3 family protein n=1 Tax=Hymenobacter busanensis TaxID=2607656 RepID=A0A7L4ZXI0_9BACT|nr:gluconate 2-dehydrogenase subunit 3 family protein [Hymenobacter busanensis]KAA9333106.1 gluconate 2-dehydrogenase subunit 3 family protein [Hymenobacter busanensis]QHJ08219.1 gluconate 2-dehydrogenase subunit 3 family protein [Hymenobacter busanensis]